MRAWDLSHHCEAAKRLRMMMRSSGWLSRRASEIWSEQGPVLPAGMEEPEYRVCPAVIRRPTLPDTLTLSVAIAYLRPEPARNETILTFSNTLDQMAAYGERDLRRFPQAHVLYEQAYALGGNCTETWRRRSPNSVSTPRGLGYNMLIRL